jgi:hypothetical protein
MRYILFWPGSCSVWRILDGLAASCFSISVFETDWVWFEAEKFGNTLTCSVFGAKTSLRAPMFYSIGTKLKVFGAPHVEDWMFSG